MKRIKKLITPPRFISYSAVGGYEEKRGALGDAFDLCDESDTFGQSTWEMAEGEMGRCALNLALSKSGLSHEILDLVIRILFYLRRISDSSYDKYSDADQDAYDNDDNER